MAEHARNFAHKGDANPDVTIKVTDEQLAKSAAHAKDILKQFQPHAEEEEDELSDTRTSLSGTALGGIVDFFHHNFMPQRELTEATLLLDARGADNPAADEEEINTEVDENARLPHLHETCVVNEAFAGGGQGIISRGTDKALRRTIAIKSMRKEILDNPALRKSFLTEAMVTAQLEHPAIVPIHGLYGDEGNGIHQAMKLVKGRTLKDELARFITLQRKTSRRFPPGVINRIFNERIDLMLKICDAVAYAHSRNIIHCDLKPENIMIGEYGEVYVMDWGLARHFHDKDGRQLPIPEGAALDGTPRYMPAETFQGEPRNEQTDIFALGLILFEMVTLRHGFTGKSIQQVIQKIRQGERNPIVNRFGYAINPDLKAIVDKATAYLPEERYRHVRDFSEDLRRYLDGLSVSARPENIIEKAFRAIRRYSRTLVLATLISWIVCAFFITRHLAMLNRQTTADLKHERAYGEMARQNIQLLEFEQYLSNMDSRVIRSAIRLSNTLVDLAGELRNVSSTAGRLLTYSLLDDAEAQNLLLSAPTVLPIIPCQEITSQSGIYSPIYKDYIKTDACSFQVPIGRDGNLIQVEVKRMGPLATSLRSLVLNSRDSLRGASQEELLDAIVNDGMLIRRAYIGVHDTSLHIAYPGSGSYGEEYDNHNRPWYQDAYKQAQETTALKPIWGKPYLDIGHKQQVITCSIPIFDSQNKFKGVAAFDIFFDTFADQLRLDGNDMTTTVLEKFLCTADGTILCHVTPNAADSHAAAPADSASVEEDAEERLKRQLSFLFQRKTERMTGGYGHFKGQERGKFIYYHYAYIPSLNFYLIEKSTEEGIQLELDKLHGDSAIPLPPDDEKAPQNPQPPEDEAIQPEEAVQPEDK